MMTPQEIREKSFEKAVFNGYDQNSVDDFINKIHEDYGALHKENTVLKSKLKVLVEKIEEYRSTEDAMRMALLSAQKMGSQIENEAREKSEAMLAQAAQEAESVIGNAKDELASEEEKLVEAKRQSALFIEKMRLLCTKQLDFFDKIGELQLDLENPDTGGQAASDEGFGDEIDSTVKTIEDSVANMVDEPEMNIELDSGPDTGSLPLSEDPFGQEQARTRPFGKRPEDTGDPFTIDFEDTRFGEDYTDN